MYLSYCYHNIYSQILYQSHNADKHQTECYTLDIVTRFKIYRYRLEDMILCSKYFTPYSWYHMSQMNLYVFIQRLYCVLVIQRAVFRQLELYFIELIFLLKKKRKCDNSICNFVRYDITLKMSAIGEINQVL